MQEISTCVAVQDVQLSDHHIHLFEKYALKNRVIWEEFPMFVTGDQPRHHSVLEHARMLEYFQKTHPECLTCSPVTQRAFSRCN